MKKLILTTGFAALLWAGFVKTSAASASSSNLRDSLSNCRDTTIHHQQKIAFLMVLNFNASTFRWRTGYRRWTTVEKIGENCPPAPTAVPINYTYYFSNNKTEVKQDVVEVRVLKEI